MKTKIGIVIAIIILLVVFALQNTDIVNVKLFFWEIKTPRALLILICMAVGVFIGFLVPSPKRQEKDKEEKEVHTDEDDKF